MSWVRHKERSMTFKLELEKIVGKERHRTDPRTGRNYTPKQT